MGRYLDRLKADYDEILGGIEIVTNRATDESRDLTEDENKQIERDSGRADELKKAIDFHAGVEESRAKVAERLGKIPPTAPAPTGQVSRDRVGGQPVDEDPDKTLLRDFPTAGDYVQTAIKAFRGDKAAAELLQRDTAHQTTADNPGLLPTPILGPVVKLINARRPFISSITRRALPGGSFDRPKVSQHVAVGIQTAEKAPTDSQQMKVDKLPVSAVTFAGHLNISRQDIKWSTPGIMQLIVDDFGDIYAIETDTWATAQFTASLGSGAAAAVTVSDWTGPAVISAIYQAAAAAASSASGILPDTLWVSPDVWGQLGSLYNAIGAPVFPSLSPTSTSGNPLGIGLVVDAHFPAGTAVLGYAAAAEWYEDLDGFIQVSEPDVLGQLVGYAGFVAFLNTAPELFTPLTVPAAGSGGGTGGSTTTTTPAD